MIEATPAAARAERRRRKRKAASAAASAEVEAARVAATEAFAAALPYRFRRPELLREALTHRSAADQRTGRLDSYERLEFLGDRVLALLVAEWLVERFPAEREGDLGKRLAMLVSQTTLAPIAERMGLDRALHVERGEQRTGVRERASVLSDALEAVLAALYIDGGLDPARDLVRREWAAVLEGDPRPPVPPKSRLQEWMLGRALGLPVYTVVSSSGPSHNPIFVVRVAGAGQEAEGVGENKRAAEQAAAAALLERLGA